MSSGVQLSVHDEALLEGAREPGGRVRADLPLPERTLRFEVVMPRDASVSELAQPCAGCGDVARELLFPVRSGWAAVWPVPRFRVPVCGACGASQRRRIRADRVLGVIVIGSTALCLALCVLVFPWLSQAVLHGVGALGAATAIAGWRIAASRKLRVAGGIEARSAARWVSARRHDACLELVSQSLAAELCAQTRGSMRPASKRPHVGGIVGAAVFVAALLLPALAAWLGSASVRVAHLSPGPLEIVVDGRSLGIVVGAVGENPAAVTVLRVPRGTRAFEARALDGSVVQRTIVHVGEGAAQLYVPVRGDDCFWVEQQSYGRTARLARRIVPLQGGSALITLSEPMDSWFAPNPAADARDRWFSGGIRRALRHGPCASQPQPPP